MWRCGTCVTSCAWSAELGWAGAHTDPAPGDMVAILPHVARVGLVLVQVGIIGVRSLRGGLTSLNRKGFRPVVVRSDRRHVAGQCVAGRPHEHKKCLTIPVCSSGSIRKKYPAFGGLSGPVFCVQKMVLFVWLTRRSGWHRILVLVRQDQGRPPNAGAADLLAPAIAWGRWACACVRRQR